MSSRLAPQGGGSQDPSVCGGGNPDYKQKEKEVGLTVRFWGMSEWEKNSLQLPT